MVEHTSLIGFHQEILEELETAHVAHHFEDFCYEGEWRDGIASGGACVFKVGVCL